MALWDMTVEQAAALPTEDLAMYAEQLAQDEANLKSKRAFLNMVAQAKYQFDPNNLGTAHPAEGVTVTVPKNVSWDQEKLDELWKRLEAMGETASEYIDVKASVPESKYKAWPESLRAMFEPARTVKPGTPKITFKVAEKEAA